MRKLIVWLYFWIATSILLFISLMLLRSFGLPAVPYTVTTLFAILVIVYCQSVRKVKK